MSLIFLQNNSFYRITRRPSILAQLSRESAEQMLSTTRLSLRMLGNRKEIKLLFLDTTHYTHLVIFLVYKWMNQCLSGNDCGLVWVCFSLASFLFLLFIFSIFNMEGLFVVLFCFFKIKNGISSCSRSCSTYPEVIVSYFGACHIKVF